MRLMSLAVRSARRLTPRPPASSASSLASARRMAVGRRRATAGSRCIGTIVGGDTVCRTNSCNFTQTPLRMIRRRATMPSVRIEAMEAHAVLLPLGRPAAFSTRNVTGREYVIVRVVGDCGATGIGYTYAGDSGGAWLRSGIDQLLAPRLVGHSAFTMDEHWERIFADLLLLGRRGALLRMLSAVDIALWDLLAKSVELPLRYLLGATTDTVPAYASGGYYRPGDACQNVIDELTRYRRLGFTDFKLKFGGLPLPEDLARVEAARTVLDATDRLALDVNNGWKTI